MAADALTESSPEPYEHYVSFYIASNNQKTIYSSRSAPSTQSDDRGKEYYNLKKYVLLSSLSLISYTY